MIVKFYLGDDEFNWNVERINKIDENVILEVKYETDMTLASLVFTAAEYKLNLNKCPLNTVGITIPVNTIMSINW